MKTDIVKIEANDSSEKYSYAVSLIRDGQVVGMPTETVYGLAASAYSEIAVKRVFEAKGRPQDNPLIVHISEFSELYDLVSEVTDSAKALADAFWPGPLTMILPKSDKVPYIVTAGLDTVAVRCPSHPVANRFIKECWVNLNVFSITYCYKLIHQALRNIFNCITSNCHCKK